MPNEFARNGGQSQKQTRYSAIYNSRFSTGIWTNRSPLRDAATTRLTERFYGPAGDALIAGSNTEITNKLTLARRPGNSPFDNNVYNTVDTFYSFRQFSSTTEQITVMIDEENALYSWFGGVKSLLYTKSSNSGQTFMQSVGNTLYFSDGVDNKKWLTTLQTWEPSMQWGVAGTPFFTTFIIDPNGNIQQLLGSIFPITYISVLINVV